MRFYILLIENQIIKDDLYVKMYVPRGTYKS